MVRVDTPSQVPERSEGSGSVRQLKDLLARLSPMISMSGTSDNTPEMLMFLSDTDPHFHTLQLVKAMRRGAREDLELTIKRLVQEHLENSNGFIKDENPVVSVLNKLFQEPKFVQFMEDFQNRLMGSSDYLHRNFESEMTSVLIEFCLSSNGPGDNTGQDSSSNSSSLNSSLNQSGFLFLSPRQYESIAGNLVNKQMIAKWPESLNQLLSVTPGEPVLQECWYDIKKGLQSCLIFPLQQQHPKQQEIFGKSLKMHSKLLASQTQSAVIEATVNLIEAGTEFWYSKKLVHFIGKKSENLNLHLCTPIFRIIKLLLMFQIDTPLLWVRYPEHLTVMLVERWLDFLIVKNDSKDQLSCGDIVCLLDPEARWLQHWLHTRYSRAKVCAALGRTPVLLRQAIRTCMKVAADSEKTFEEGETAAEARAQPKFSLEQYHRLKFLYSVNFVLEILKYSEGRQLFPMGVSADEKKMTIGKVLNVLHSFTSNTKDLKLANLVREKIKDFCIGNEPIAELMSKSELVRKYTNSLLSKRHRIDREAISLQLKTLQAVSETGTGKKHILLGPHDNGSSHLTRATDCDQLLELFGRLLVEEYQMSLNYAVTFEMTTSLIRSPVGRHLYSGHQTFKQTLTNLTSLYHKSLLGVLEAVADGSIAIEHRQSLLRQTAASALSRGRGMDILVQSDPLYQPEDAVPAEEGDSLATLSAQAVAILCSTEHGIVALDSVTEEDPTLLWLENSDQPPPLPLLACATSFQGVSLLLRRGLRTLAVALFSGQRVQQREAGLTLVAAAGGRLDARLLLQDKLGYQEELQKQQEECQEEEEEECEGRFIVDECSLLRLHILRRAAHLGTEHPPLPTVPPGANLELDQLAHVSGGHRPSVRRQQPQQSGLWHFVSNSRVAVHDQTWLIHCRRHFQAAVMAGDTIKPGHVLDMLEWALDAQNQSAEILEPVGGQDDLSPRLAPVAALVAEALQQHEHTETMTRAAMQLAQRYAGQLELVGVGHWSSDRLLQLLENTRENVPGAERHHNTDWLTIVLYILSDGHHIRASEVSAKLSVSLAGRMLWPLLGSSEQVVRLTRLLLSLHHPATYDALQWYSTGCIWNLLHGWLDGCWLGVMPWSEVCHWLVTVVLFGPDYVVYLSVEVLKHRLHQLLDKLTTLPTTSDRLLSLQTEELQGWRLSEHLQAATDLSKAHRRLLVSQMR